VKAALVAASIVACLLAACSHMADNCEDLGTCPPLDAGAPTDPCRGTCVAGDVSASLTMEPWIVWLGNVQAPNDLCETQVHEAPHEAFDGTVAPSPPVCPVCTCSESSGSCAILAVTDSTATCMDSMPGLTLPLPLPNGWDGSCIALPPVSGVVASVTVEPLAVVDEGCTPQPVTTTTSPHPQAWSYAHACGGFATGTCPNDGDVCVPALPVGDVPKGLPKGVWTYCVSYTSSDTTAKCPAEYPVRRDFGNGWTDPRHCADCTCGPPVGSSCDESLVTLYSDDACTDADEVGAVEAQQSTQMCVDVPEAPGSMTAASSVYMSGTCTPGGGGIVGGPPTPAEPMAFCCQE
jgi:hypothetical protein